ncbi:Ger(x)C family spore germination protein [Clostridium aciditolerans]|uniref:Ger(X)C family spore germination protein n=1 Tax=Clostridium aciditolerans TaxID=339861 RepID=A0A934HWN2_9CLOT|nr:Ger(x)C family spore germination protein [Clostridium aciditolerans]MBI6872153.1 Ger(x)C family spore germination protein [Clostridium aciditolerans]
MNKKLNNKIFIYLIIVVIFLYAFLGSKGELVENLEIPIGIGYDLKTEGENDVTYSTPIAAYLFETEEVDSEIMVGKASSIGETRETRQLESSKSFLLGIERIFLFSEQYAEYGIGTAIDILLNNPQINDRAFTLVCKEKAEDILSHKIKGYANSAEFIEGLMKNSKQFNFFPEHQSSLMDVFVRVDAEGRNTLLPYIELKDKNIELTGYAIFKGDKMVLKTNIEEAKIINILKENKVKGILTIQDNSKNYINYYAESKRKVKCYKENDKLKFVIDLSLNGSIINNTLYLNLINDPKVLKKFTKDMEENLKETCENFINNKIKGEYKVDVLDLGRVAAAKYGRGKNIDWNKVIPQSIIEVNVKVKVDTEGRGNYQLPTKK